MTLARICSFALLAGFLRAADDPQQAARAAMEASVAKQKESVQKQVKTAQPVPAGWWTTPWPREENWIKPIEPIRQTEETAQPRASLDLPCLPLSASMLDPEIEQAAGRENLPSDLLRAVVRRESAGYPCAVSNKGAMGLMQLMPSTAAMFGVTDPFNPISNLGAGAKFLGQLMERYKGDISKALAAYNAGPGKVDAYGGIPPYPETKSYVSEILGALGAGQ